MSYTADIFEKGIDADGALFIKVKYSDGASDASKATVFKKHATLRQTASWSNDVVNAYLAELNAFDLDNIKLGAPAEPAVVEPTQDALNARALDKNLSSLQQALTIKAALESASKISDPKIKALADSVESLVQIADPVSAEG